jgi:hypothetical protein
MVGRGPLGAGVRYWETRARQWMGLAGASSPEVRASSLELVGQARIASWWNVDLLAIAGGGRLHLAWQPDRGVIQPAAGSPIEVELDPIDTWIGGAGLGLRRSLVRGLEAGLEVDHRIYQLNTAHRDGDTIEERRETFGEWGARLGLGWTSRR